MENNPAPMNANSGSTVPQPLQKSGKGLTVALVIVIILAIAAVVGTWYYMNNKAKNDKKAQDAQIQQLQNQLNELKNNNSNSSSNSSQPANTFAVNIPEIGVTLNVPDAIKDLQYKVGSGTITQGNIKVTTVEFSTASLTKADPQCENQIGSISKVETKYSANNNYGYGPLIKQYPSYYLTFAGPQATCSNNQTVITQQTQALNYLKQSIINTFGLSQNALQ